MSSRPSIRIAFVGGMIAALTGVATAQEIQVTVDDVQCLPIAENGIGWATVENEEPGTTTRLYFRRMNDTVEDFYWVQMRPSSPGRYWAAFPKPADQEIQEHSLENIDENKASLGRLDAEFGITTPSDADLERNAFAAWWRAREGSDHRDPDDELDKDEIRERASLGKLERRHWMGEMSYSDLQRWLDDQRQEPAEFFVAVHDAEGRRLAQSVTKVTPVTNDCRVDLSPQEQGESENLVVGESANWQRGEEIFHWLCDGVVSRVDPLDVKREDEFCRACVIAWWKTKGFLVPAGTALALIPGVIVLDEDDPPTVSPITP